MRGETGTRFASRAGGLAFFLYFSCAIYGATTGDAIALRAGQFIGIGALLAGLTGLPKRYERALVFTGLLLGSAFLSSLIIGRQAPGFGNGAAIIASAGIALLFLRGRVDYWAPYIVFVGTSAYVATRLWLVGVGPEADLFTSAGSANSASVFVIFGCVPLYLVAIQRGRRLPVIPAIVAFAISTAATGRAGIIASAFLLLWVLWFGMRLSRFWVIMATGAVASWLLVSEVVLLTYFRELYLRRLASAGRDQIWLDYLQALDLKGVLFGVDIVRLPSLAEYDANLHNSFLALHAYTGIASAVFGIVLVAALASYVWRKHAFAGLLLALLIRSSTDHIFFFTLFDFLLLFFVFDYLARGRAPQIHRPARTPQRVAAHAAMLGNA